MSAASSVLLYAAPALSQPSATQPSATQPGPDCPDVQVLFTRGSGELPGLGIVGAPFVKMLTAALPGKKVESYAVEYGANWNQKTAPDGATDISREIVEFAARCSETTFVLGGYSQGASATAIALGVPTNFGQGEVIPEALAPRIAAVVTFGDPLGRRKGTIETQSALYGDRARTYCAVGDPVCSTGVNVLAHLSYAFNSTVPDAVAFTSSKVLALTP
ncbi:cutinase family protein [Rhodococcus sp. G-MC3]|uniref:cutinase family protein n=1 Tax=Rhodococcus sp. G-MC3 TaxID=3046209 RepID=UPI0024B9B8BB|nr:cutinase family protein [Rhodococcus sp. G-MC3]